MGSKIKKKKRNLKVKDNYVSISNYDTNNIFRPPWFNILLSPICPSLFLENYKKSLELSEK